ncbi:hypothetical protein HR12_23510 [Microbacterium sp. SUBG005]|nr:hypothetical protein HR12_23510 [Microbacterium sp. SUBG005]
MSRKKNWYQRTRRGGETHIRLGEGPYVSVFCRGSDAHPHAKYRVCSFVPSDQPGVSSWVNNPSGYAEHDKEHYFRIVPGISQWLIGDAWLSQPERRDHRYDDAFRERWVLTCPTCGVTKPFAQPASLSTAISALASLRSQDQILEVSLRGFLDHVERWRDTPEQQ